MNTYHQPIRTTLTRGVVVALALLATAAAHAQQNVRPDTPIPITVGSPDIVNSVVVFSNTDPNFKTVAISGITPQFFRGEDLHMVRGGLLTSFQFAVVPFPGIDAEVAINFYANDAVDEGVMPGDFGLLDDLIATIPAGILPSPASPEFMYVVDVEVNPPVLLPRDVWAVIVVLSPLDGDMFTALASDPEIGTSHPITYIDSVQFQFHDFGSLNIHFVVRMEPDASDTTTGTNVSVEPEPGVTLTYSNVTQAGATTVTTSGTNPEPDSNFEFLGVFYEIETTATFAGQVEVCFDYDDTGLSIDQENSLQLLHFDGTSWVDITSSIDTTSNVICGLTNSFSLFAVGHAVPHPAQELIGQLIDDVSALNVRQGIANSLDAKLDRARNALDDFNANNNAAAVNAIAALVEEVQAQRGVQIAEEDADVLINLAIDILLLL